MNTKEKKRIITCLWGIFFASITKANHIKICCNKLAIEGAFTLSKTFFQVHKQQYQLLYHLMIISTIFSAKLEIK